MTASMGFSEETSYWLTKCAGLGEILFGLLLFVCYRSKPIILLNIFALTSLLLFVAIMQPQLLIEAFNPVTTNIAIIALSLVLLKTNEPLSSK